MPQLLPCCFPSHRLPHWPRAPSRLNPCRSPPVRLGPPERSFRSLVPGSSCPTRRGKVWLADPDLTFSTCNSLQTGSMLIRRRMKKTRPMRNCSPTGAMLRARSAETRPRILPGRPSLETTAAETQISMAGQLPGVMRPPIRLPFSVFRLHKAPARIRQVSASTC